MNSVNLWQIMWQQAEYWRLGLAILSGIFVGIIYFESLRWSVNHIHSFKHKWSVFGGIALLRIALFFGIMILVAGKNIVLLLFYLAAFFITKLFIIWYEKHGLIVDKSRSADD